MIYLIIATVLFSLSFGLIKEQLSSLPSEFVVFSRLLIATLIFFPFCKNLNIKKHLKAILIGAIQFGIMYLCFIKAFKYLQGNEIAILTTTTPIFVGIWSAILGEKFRPIYIFCIFLSVIGAVVILWQNISFDMLVKGILLMECSNCAFALGQVLWKKYIGKTETNLMASAYLGAVLLVIPFAVSNVNFSSLKLSIAQILSILYLAILPTGIGFWMWNKGSASVKYSTLAVMNNLKIPLGVLFSIFIFNEKINIINFSIGSTIIIVAILVLHFYLKK